MASFSSIILEDHFTGKTHDLKKGKLSIEMNSNDPIDRFTLSLKNEEEMTSSWHTDEVIFRKDKLKTTIVFPKENENYKVLIYSLQQNQPIQVFNSNFQNELTVPNHLIPSGINLIIVKSNEKVFFEKFFYQ